MQTRATLMTMAAALGLLCAITSVVTATPAHMKSYTDYYKGSKATCNTCHTQAPKLNPYGTALKGQLKGAKKLTPAMFKAAEAKKPK